jgi:hypothetical protein
LVLEWEFLFDLLLTSVLVQICPPTQGNPYARAEGGIEQDPLVERWHPLLQVQAAEGVVVHFHAEARTIRARVMSPWREGRT